MPKWPGEVPICEKKSQFADFYPPDNHLPQAKNSSLTFKVETNKFSLNNAYS